MFLFSKSTRNFILFHTWDSVHIYAILFCRSFFKPHHIGSTSQHNSMTVPSLGKWGGKPESPA